MARKLTEAQEWEATKRIAEGESQADVARTYNVSRSTIGRLEGIAGAYEARYLLEWFRVCRMPDVIAVEILSALLSTISERILRAGALDDAEKQGVRLFDERRRLDRIRRIQSDRNLRPGVSAEAERIRRSRERVPEMVADVGLFLAIRVTSDRIMAGWDPQEAV